MNEIIGVRTNDGVRIEINKLIEELNQIEDSFRQIDKYRKFIEQDINLKSEINKERQKDIFIYILNGGGYSSLSKKYNITSVRVKQIFLRQLNVLRAYILYKGLAKNRINDGIKEAKDNKDFWLDILEKVKTFNPELRK